MSSFETCLAWTMQWEDPHLLCAQTPDAPPGAFAIAGINSAAWPAEFAAIAAMPQDERGNAVTDFYEEHFWNDWLAQIASDDVAKRVFDASVNMGPVTAIEILQKAVLQYDPDAALDVDGVFGPHTIMRVNLEAPASLVTAFCAQRVEHYQQIVAKNPDDAKYLAGWTARAIA